MGRVPLKPGQYADGMPIHSPEYICCKLIHRPDNFHSRESFFDFGKVFKESAKEHGVKFTTEGFVEQPVNIREVLFVDTDDFRLYNNTFILRRRIPYKDGFPIGEPEIVFKFRHPELQAAAETDVGPISLAITASSSRCKPYRLTRSSEESVCSTPTMFSFTARPLAWAARTSATWTP